MLIHMDGYDFATHRGIVEWVREHDWALDASAIRRLTLPRFAPVDGIVTIVAQPKTVSWLRQFGCPIVRMHSTPTREAHLACAGLPAVEYDFASMGRLGAEHLLRLGRPHFVFYQRGAGEDANLICQSFVATLRAAGHEPTVFDFIADHPDRPILRPTSLTDRVGWLTARMRRTPTPMAIMAEDDRFAPDVVEAARRLGLQVPTDVAVLGCDDNPVWHGVSPIPISSVDSNAFGVGYAAAALLARIVDGEVPPVETLQVPARRVISRESTATYAGAHPGVNLALGHIRQHYREPLHLEGLARIAKMSVRSLQNAFRQELGCTLQKELARLRLAAATRLLEETDLKLDAVAADSNLGDAKNLCRVFAKMHGISPNEWRRKHRLGQ
jgi:LacI family transcriptional regulator